MPARDLDYQHVRRVLTADGWTITHDPLRLRYGVRDLYVDLGAERLLAADKGPVKIAVEIKSFAGASIVDDLEKAIGQFTLYLAVLERIEPQRILYLAVSTAVYDEVFNEPLGQLLLAKGPIKLLVYHSEQESITQWTPEPPTVK